MSDASACDEKVVAGFSERASASALLCSKPTIKVLTGNDALARAHGVADALKAGVMVPFLGPGVFPAEAAGIPLTPEAVAAELNKRHPSPGRIRNNMWGVAQFIEQRRHRKTLAAFMMDIFKADIAPTALHIALAGLKLPMIVDSWYDGAMRAALVAVEKSSSDAFSSREPEATSLENAMSWGEIHGITRAVERDAQWYKAYTSAGEPCPMEAAESWETLLYKPHGSIKPNGQVLVADSDYVEVLTEIDIQTPIPDIVKERRAARGFVFIGCRFHDQMLRTYARQIIKRAGEGHVAFVGTESLTNNELKFFEAEGITPIALEASALAALLGA